MKVGLFVRQIPFYIIQNKPSPKGPSMSWRMRRSKKRGEVEEEEEDEEDEDEERKDFVGFPISQSSPNSAPLRSPPVPETQRPAPPTNGERRPRGRPPKNWPWGKGKDNTQPGRPPKIRPVDDEDEDDETTEQDKTHGSASSPPSLFSLNRQTEAVSFHKLGMTSHSITPSRRGRPPRKKRGPKPRLTDGPGDNLVQLSGVPRLSDSSPVRKSCFSESSEEEEEEEDDEDEDEDEDDVDRNACSPPMLTKPAMGLKCKVRHLQKFLQSFK